VEGVFRFLRKSWRLVAGLPVVERELDKNELKILHATIKKVTEDTESLDFNTAISQMMIFVNEFGSKPEIPREAAEAYVKLLSPYAPHIAEELWEMLGHADTIAYEPWPLFDETFLKEDEAEILVQLMGKPLVKIMMPADAGKDEMEKLALDHPDVAAAVEGKTVRKVVCVPKRLVNIVAN
jgi:leucyl-tRNA synthetase